MAVLDAVASNVLIMSDDVTSNIKGLTVSQQIVLVQQVDKNLKPQHPASVIRIDHLVEVNKTVALAASNALVLSQVTYPRSITLEVTQQFFAWQDILNDEFAPLVTSILTLTQSAIAAVAKGVYDTLTLTQSVHVEKTLNLNVGQTFVMVSSVIGYLPDKYWSSYPITVIEP